MSSNIERQQDNETATFSHQYYRFQALNPNKQIEQSPSKSQSPQSSIVMPQALIQNSNIQNGTLQFQQMNSPPIEANLQEKNTLQMTFYPQQPVSLQKRSSLQHLKRQQIKLKKKLLGFNQTLTQMVNKQSEVVNQYESVIRQQKAQQRILANLNEQYEAYCTMLQANYELKVDEEYESQSRRVVELRKEVHELNIQLSKPMIKDIQKHNQKVENLQKQFYQLQIIIEKLNFSNVKKQQKFEELKEQIQQKQQKIKKINFKIAQIEEDSEADLTISQKANFNYKDQYEALIVKHSRLRKIIDQFEKKKELELSKRLKQMKEKDILLKDMARQIKVIDSKRKIQLQDLKKVQQDKRKMIIEKVKKQDLERGQIQTRIITLERMVNTVAESKVQVGPSRTTNRSKAMDQNKNISFKRQHSRQSRHSEGVQHQKSVTEGNEPNRLELSLRRKKIYTQLEKNKYFQNIKRHQKQKLSTVDEPEELKFPDIREKSLLSQPSQNESIIHQTRYFDTEQEESSGPRACIQQHNNRIRQLRQNKRRFNQSNYLELCKSLQKDKLLIEEDCEYEMEDLIYNSKF